MAICGPTTNRLPPSEPAACGAKVTFTVTLCPGSRVKGSVGPLRENPFPVVWKPESVTFEDWAFASTTGTVELAPIATSPNGTFEGLAVADSLLTPVPLTSSTRVAFEASLNNLMTPSVQTKAVGVKVTLSSALCPADKTRGRLTPDGTNAGLLKVIFETVRLVGPLFVTVTNWLSVWPTTMWPNRRLAGAHASCGVA